ncbi:MAG: response regulator [Acidobacteriota bacterium]|nr:response regulator [Acidobacteriota bacterium]
MALEVRDTGVGMDEETLARVFDPFFSTKALGRGAGLGLSNAYGIVRQGGDDVQVFSRVGEGTTSRLLLPFCAEALEVAPRRPPTPRHAEGHTVVVEDEPSVAGLIGCVLEAGDYRVVCYPDGATAALEGPQAPAYDLLIPDVVMPGITGPELARRFGARLAGRRVLFLSGCADPARIAHGFEAGRVPLLRKPFSAAARLEAVHRVLCGKILASRASDLLGSVDSVFRGPARRGSDPAGPGRSARPWSGRYP